MGVVKRMLLAIDRWQRRHRMAATAFAVVKKFGDDQANLYVVGLGWYGFTAIYPLLLVVVTIFGFLGSSLGNGIVATLHQFPVIGADFNAGRGGSNLHGSVAGLVIGVAGLIYGAQGVTQTAQQTMAQVWNVPQVKRAGFLTRLIRSLAGLLIIGFAFLVNAFVGAIAAGHGQGLLLRVLLTVGLLVLNVGLYYASFWILTPPAVTDRRFLPGAILGAVGFTALTTVGTGLVQHQLRHTSATYGAFASVIGVVTYLLLLAKLTVYAAELNPVLARHLWPRALPMAPPTEADERVLSALVAQQRQWPEERIEVDFEPDPVTAPEVPDKASIGNGRAPDGRPAPSPPPPRQAAPSAARAAKRPNVSTVEWLGRRGDDR